MDADQLSVVALDGAHLDGPPPTKEAFLHVAMLRVRPDANAVVHTHSVHAAAVSCLSDVDAENPIPPLTAYYGMRVGTLRMLPYYAAGRPGCDRCCGGCRARHPRPAPAQPRPRRRGGGS